MKYRVLIILEECDQDCIENGCCEENFDFAKELGIFDNIKDAVNLIEQTVNQ